MADMLLSLLIIILGLSIGYLYQRLMLSGKLSPKASITTTRKRLQVLSLIWITPYPIIASVWIAPLKHPSIASLPFIGLTILAIGAFLAYIGSRLLHQTPRERAVYVVCGGFTNMGNLGALIVFFLLGETGYALAPFYMLLERVFYFLFGFPYAKKISELDSDDTDTGKMANESGLRQILKNLINPFVVVTISSIIVGLILNISEVNRPEIIGTINGYVIPVNSLILLASIGMALRFRHLMPYIKPAVFMSIIKSLILPVIAVCIGYMLGLHHIENGLPLKVVLILSAMPVGFTALVPPTVYDLDIDFANANWIVTTSAMLVIVPLLWAVITYVF